MKWLLLFIGIAAQSISATFMKLSMGFTNLVPTTLAVVFWAVSMSVFIFALRNFDLSYAFALYAGLGVVLVALIGVVFLKEPVSFLKMGSIFLIALGVAGLNI